MSENNDNKIHNIDFANLNNLELVELLSTLEVMDDILKEQENKIKEGEQIEK